ncbi:MAG TPA: MFS transporter [Stellaceae bacterium]|nr:MFS transporter [Stellaceae bacterium]
MAGGITMGARLDRLPVAPFHYRVFCLIAAGMFFDGYDLYVAAPVLGAAMQSGFSTVAQNGWFISLTFLGMTLGSLLAGFLGDRYGRRFAYQFNLMIFGLASLAAAFAPDIETLNALRFVMGVGLGAEIVVGYGTMTEFVPPRVRGTWMALMALVVVAGLPVTAFLAWLIVPGHGWRPMFVIAGLGALVVWYLRKNLPESPRWLEAKGRNDEAEALMQRIEREAAGSGALPPPVPAPPLPSLGLAALLSPSLLPRMVVGSVVLITTNALIFGFVTWLPIFFGQQGLTIAKSLGYTLVIDLGSLAGCALGALSADRAGRRPTIIAASLWTILFGALYPLVAASRAVLAVGFLLFIGIYVLTSILYGVYTAELFPTEVRLRANGICNMFGRGATILTPLIVVALFKAYGVAGVLAFMIALLVVQIAVVALWGIEPARRGLEDLDRTRETGLTRAPAARPSAPA